VLNRVVNQGRLKKVRNEIIHNLKATYKETDIYKVLQTGDLANLDGLPEDEQEKLRHLRELKDAIYSEEFRAFVQDITGCGELVEKTDCSCNIYAQGGHLLCHDDVIGTRRVSYIIYLTDPENEWRSEDGGALALYDCIDNPEEKGKKLPLPQSHPLKRILPLWNTMVMFAVLPGKSFHDIEEVVTSDNPRLSISGWFHGKTPPEGSEKATLNQILANGKKGEEQSSAIANLDKVDPFSKFDSPVDAQEWLDEDDINLLAKYVNVQYLVKGTAEKIAEKFVEESHIQLHSFLNEEWAQRMSQGVKKLDEKEDFYVTKIPSYTSGVNEAWKVRGPTHKQRYLELSQSETSDDDEVSKMLREVNTACFGSKAFQKLACFMTKVAINSTRSTVRRLRPGLDYTMAHNGVETTDYQLDATFSFVDSSEQWAIGEVGAYDCYMVNDSEAEGVNNASAEVYRETREEDDETITLPATRNCLNLVLSNEGVMKFTKYVSANAPGSRWDIINEYEITPEDDEDEAGGIDLN
jgi:Rps23 Pro-64 3,4-dihydroxylase Tpa1-like proline 4-hydroxylase